MRQQCLKIRHSLVQRLRSLFRRAVQLILAGAGFIQRRGKTRPVIIQLMRRLHIAGGRA